MIPHPIEVESFGIISELVDLRGFSDLEAEVLARVIHSTTDLDYPKRSLFSSGFLARALDLVKAGSPIITDVAMTAAGITGRRAISALSLEYVAAENETNSFASMRTAAEKYPTALFVIGCSPTSLEALIAAEDSITGSAVIGIPVGFVGAAEAKRRLVDTSLEYFTNIGLTGGSAAAAAAANALIRIDSGHRYIMNGRVVEPYHADLDQ